MSNWTPDDVYDPKPRRRGPRILAALALTVLVSAGGGWWLASASPWADEVQARLAASPLGQALEAIWSFWGSGQRLARFAPADTRVYLELSPSWWSRLGLWGIAMQPSATGEDAPAELRQLVRERWGLDWEADIAPWLAPEFGIIGFGTGAGAKGPGGPAPGARDVGAWAMVAGTQDEAAARAFVVKLRTRRVVGGEVASVGEHAGVRYDVLTPAREAPYALAVLHDYVVMATPPGAMDVLIAQAAGGRPTLAASNPRYRRIAGAWSRGAVGQAFLDAGAEGAPQRAPAGGLPPLEAVGGTLTGGTDWGTLQLTAAFTVAGAPAADRERWRTLMPPHEPRHFDRLPADTVVAAAGTANEALGEWLAGPLATAWLPLGGAPVEGAAFTGLLAALKGVRGPFAAGIVALPAAAGATHPVGAVLAVRPEAPDALEAALNQAAAALVAPLDPARLPGAAGQWAAQPWLGGWLPKAAELAEERHRGEPWKVLKAAGQPLAGWTRTGDEMLLAGGREALGLCQAEPFRPLSASPPFVAVRGQLPREAAAVLYFDGENGRDLIDGSLVPAKYAAEARQALGSLRAFGMSAEPGIDAAGFHRSALTVSIAPPRETPE